MVPSKCKEVEEILEKTEDKQRATTNTVVGKDLTSDRGAVLLPQGKPASKKQLVKIGIGSVIAALAVGIGCSIAGVALPILALIGIAVAAALVIGVIAGGITYSVSKPSDKLDKPDLEANQQVNEVC